MEIIARRKDSLFTSWIIAAAVVGLGFVFLLAYIARLTGFGSSWESVAVWLFSIAIFGVVLALPLGISIWQIKKFKETPSIPIVYENGKVRFVNHFECAPEEIQNVTYRQARGGKYGWYTYSWGRLTVHVRGRDITYYFIEDVVAVHDRLLKLMLQARESKND